MQVVNLIQGSPEWHAHRATHFNASDAPAMLGESDHETRDKLLTRIKTGLSKEFSQFVQDNIIDPGHKFEGLARQIAEKIIGDDLSPTVGVEGFYSASFDGITFMGDVIWEHKRLNKQLRAAIRESGGNANEFLPAMYRIQLEQQLLISGAEKALFMASEWDEDGNLVEELHCWYTPDLKLRQRIVDGWALFEKDLDTHVPAAVVAKVEAETVQPLPVPSVVVKGEITQSNLKDIIPKFDDYLAGVNTELKTDQDFADAEANAKNCRETAKRIEALQENIIAQMVSVNEVNGVLDNYKKSFNTLGLRLEKAVKDQKESLKTTAILTAQQAYTMHVQSLEKEVSPIRLNLSMPDFGGAIKGIKTVASMHSRINDALANGKLNADAIARDIREKQAWLKDNADGYQFLFADIQTIIHKPLDDLQLLAKSRISEHKDAEAEKEAQRQAEAEAAARQKIEQENAAKAQQEQSQTAPEAPAASNDEVQPETAKPLEVVQPATSASGSSGGRVSQTSATSRQAPNAQQIALALASYYRVEPETTTQWLINTDFSVLKKAA